jgi:hypothetical protein
MPEMDVPAVAHVPMMSADPLTPLWDDLQGDWHPAQILSRVPMSTN